MSDAVSPSQVAERLIQQLEDLTQCPICRNQFTDPRCFPCLHTFCTHCLDELFSRNDADDNQQDAGANAKTGVRCPVCRKTCPADGASSLTANFFIESLIETKRIASVLSGKRQNCQVCGVDDDDVENDDSADKKTPAHAYCGDCQQFLCKSCFK